MKRRTLNWLLQNKTIRQFLYIVAILAGVNNSPAQIANYVNNGGFEEYWSCTFPNEIRKVKYWRSIDSLQGNSLYYNSCSGLGNVPANGQTFQYPKEGDGYIIVTTYCLNGSCNSNFNRSYARNRLKEKLYAGVTYCVRFYVNLVNTSSYGSDGVGVVFTDNNSIDTITKCNIPLTYFQPQVSNTAGNVITDTLNWTLVTGTFVAAGNETNLLIGNFKSDGNTNTSLSNPTWLPIIESDFVVDAVSCIALNLPAFAHSSNDVYAIPGNTLYLGRQRDVGIDEACMWYKLPNTTTALDTAAGITITVAATTETYMVKQDICGVIKYDTVVVHTSGLGNLEWERLIDELVLAPNPASDQVEIQINNVEIKNRVTRVDVVNSLGQSLLTEQFDSPEKIVLNVSLISNGVYQVRVSFDEKLNHVRKLVISR